MEIITNFQIDPVDIWAYTEKTGEEVTKRGLEFFERTRPFINGMGPDSKTDMPPEMGIFHPHVDDRFIVDFTDGSFDADKSVTAKYVKSERGAAYKMIVFTEGTLWIYMMGKRPRCILRQLVDRALEEAGVEFDVIGSDYIFKTEEKFSVYAIYTNSLGYYYENYVFTFDYNDAFFQEVLPYVFYSRTYTGRTASGIRGILDKYPAFEQKTVLRTEYRDIWF